MLATAVIVHRKAVRLLREGGVSWISVEWLPAYAPDLNPVEAVWNHTKHADLANLIPHDVDHLFDEVLAARGSIPFSLPAVAGHRGPA